jgi:NAD(P)H-hydrate epimerase
MRILRAEETAAVAAAIDPALLRERAGYAVAQFCATQFTFRSVCIVCGTGAKGAAGLAAAAVLIGIAEEIALLVLAGGIAEFDPAAELTPPIEPIWIADPAGFDDPAAQAALCADLVIDAIGDAEFRSRLDPRAARAVAAINDAAGLVVAIDSPTGIDPDSREAVAASGGNMVFAHGILALVAPRPAHVFGDLTAGPIAINELGTQPALIAGGDPISVVTGADVGLAFPRRASTAVERDFGHVLIVGGERGRAGAAALAGLAALHAGAGRVTVACPHSSAATVAGFDASLLTYALPETPDGRIDGATPDHLASLLDGKHVVVLGPGLADRSETAAAIRQLAAACRVPLVTGIGALVAGGDGAGAPYRVLVLDPSAEPPEDGMGMVRRIAASHTACVVLRGARSLVAGLSGELWVNLTGGPALAKAGAGEILAGMIGAALARRRVDGETTKGLSGARRLLLRDLAVAAAVHLHGLAGDLARDALHEHAVVARDLIDALPEAFRLCDRQIEQGLFYLNR